MSDGSLDALLPFADPALPPPMVKEAIAGLAGVKHERAQGALVTLVHGLETMLAKKGDAPFDEAELQPLLDRAVAALARFGSPTARRVVVEHGLRRKSGLGDVGARLAELATQDLTDDPELVSLLLKSARAEMPFKVFGLTLKKREDRLAPIVEALSGTPTQAVRKVFDEIVEKHADTPAARVASKALASFDAPKAVDEGQASLMGDLAIFELPALLQSLASTEVTGTLALRDPAGAVVGKFILENGRIRTAEAFGLKGDDACYQLFERPTGGTFSFVRQPALPPLREGEALRESRVDPPRGDAPVRRLPALRGARAGRPGPRADGHETVHRPGGGRRGSPEGGVDEGVQRNVREEDRVGGGRRLVSDPQTARQVGGRRKPQGRLTAVGLPPLISLPSPRTAP